MFLKALVGHLRDMDLKFVISGQKAGTKLALLETDEHAIFSNLNGRSFRRGDIYLDLSCEVRLCRFLFFTCICCT